MNQLSFTDRIQKCGEKMYPSPGGRSGLRHLLSNSPDRLIAHLEPTANLSITQLWMLCEGLSDPLEPKVLNQLLDRACLDSLAQFFPGRSRIGAVNPAPKGEAEVVLQQPLKRLWTAFLSIHQSVNQDRCGKFLERFHKIGIVIFPTPPDLEVSPFFFYEVRFCKFSMW